MKYINILLFMILLTVTVSWNSEKPAESTLKYERARLKAEKSYECLAYAKSIRLYKKVLQINEDDREAILRIANSYRMINDPEKAVAWYKRADEEGFMTAKEDQLLYAHVLSGLGRYEEADQWYRMHGEDGQMKEVVKNKLAAINSLETYFRDSMAYLVKPVSFNSEHSDFGPAYLKDGLVFASARPSKALFKAKYNRDNSYFLDMYRVESDGKPERLSGQLNTKYHEGPAVFFDNDRKVIFTRNNFHEGKSSESEDGVNKLKLFYAELAEGGDQWTDPVELPFNHDNFSVGHPAISADGKTLYFASDMPGGLGGSDIYKSEFRNGEWTDPQNLGDRINTPGNEFFPFVHNDLTLYYSSDGMPGIGGLDIYEVALDGNQDPVNIGSPINTSKDDFGIIVNADGRSGYLSSNRDGGSGSDDIYHFEKYFYDIEIRFVHAGNGELLEAKVEQLKGTSADVSRTVSRESELSFRLLRGSYVEIIASKEGFESVSYQVRTEDFPRVLTEKVVIELPMKPIPNDVFRDVILVNNNGQNSQVFAISETPQEFSGNFEELKERFDDNKLKIGKVHQISNIYYDFDRYEIREDAVIELDRVIALMQKFENLSVQLRAHTDIRGTSLYNTELSLKRAVAAKQHLMAAGIAEEKIRIESYGEDQVFTDCKNGCDEVGHQMNRRTEITLVAEE